MDSEVDVILLKTAWSVGSVCVCACTGDLMYSVWYCDWLYYFATLLRLGVIHVTARNFWYAMFICTHMIRYTADLGCVARMAFASLLSTLYIWQMYNVMLQLMPYSTNTVAVFAIVGILNIYLFNLRASWVNTFSS